MKKIFGLLLLTLIFYKSNSQIVPSNTHRIDSVITIPLTDQTMGNTILKRKASLFSMLYNMQHKELVLDWIINYYSDSSGTYGSVVSFPGIQSYPIEFIADNSTYVNAANGSIQTYDSLFSFNAGYDTSIVLMTQYEWFTQVAANQSVNIFQMIYEFGITGFQTRGDY